MLPKRAQKQWALNTVSNLLPFFSPSNLGKIKVAIDDEETSLHLVFALRLLSSEESEDCSKGRTTCELFCTKVSFKFSGLVLFKATEISVFKLVKDSELLLSVVAICPKRGRLELIAFEDVEVFSKSSIVEYSIDSLSTIGSLLQLSSKFEDLSSNWLDLLEIFFDIFNELLRGPLNSESVLQKRS